MTKGKTIIQRAEEYLSIDNHRQLKDTFLEKYSKCEVLCRPLLRKYLKSIGEFTSDEDIGMELQDIRCALSEEGYNFDDNKLLTRIWGKNNTLGSSSCRYLRNKIIHELMIRALHEVVDRSDELNADMDKFIDELTSF